MAGLQPQAGPGAYAAAVSRVLLQRGARLGEGGRRHLQGRLRQQGRGLRLRAWRPRRHHQPVLAHRRHHQPAELVLHDRHAATTPTRRCVHSFIDRVEQERHPLAQHLADAGRDDPAAAEGHPERVRIVPEAVRNGHLQHARLDGLRRGPDEDGRRIVHRARSGRPRTSVIPRRRTATPSTQSCSAGPEMGSR